MLLNFWDMEGPAREAARNVWQSNLAIIGGLLIAAAHAIGQAGYRRASLPKPAWPVTVGQERPRCQIL